MAWALEQQFVTDTGARHVLLCLCNYAGESGLGAFPSSQTLADHTGMSKRNVQRKLDDLETVGLIRRGNQALAAVYISRADRRPVVYDVLMRPIPRDDKASPRIERGDKSTVYGVTNTALRGDTVSPKPPINHQVTRKELSAQPTASRFGAWWDAYPKKVGRKKAEQLWNRRRLDGMAERLVADVLHRAANDDGWQRGYAPDPCTYINQDRWDDALRVAPTAGPAPSAPSKTLSAIQKLEGMKNGMANPRTDDRLSKTAVLELGAHAGD